MNPLDTTGFPPRWDCGTAWSDEPWIGWLHVVSDLLICGAYFAVPIVVMYFVRQRDDLKFPPIFYAFLSAIFFSCGFVHLIEASIFWWPIYRMSGFAKFLTAVFSASGVVLLARVLPAALELKSGKAYAAEVAQRRKTQEQLQYEQFMLRTMMEHLPDLIYFKDKQSRFTRVSDSLVAFLGADSVDDVLGKSDFDFFPSEFATVARADEMRLMNTGEPVIGKEEPEHTSDGEQIWLSSTKLPLRAPTGQVIGIFGLSRDITPQKRAADVMSEAKEAAEAANRAKSDFLANMSHEIRTPMNSVMGMTELVLQTELTPTQREYLDIVYGSAESLLSVINEILDFSKIEAGKLEFHSEPTALRDLIGSALQSLALRAHDKGLELAWYVQPDVPDQFQTDPGRLRQVVVNLVGNAIKFTSEGEVVVEVVADDKFTRTPAGESDEPTRLHFVVRDTGIGIHQQDLDTIFDPFEQADGSPTRPFEGTGLGLTITKRVVEMMQGQLWATSTIGEGSQFHFVVELPRSTEMSSAETDALDLRSLRVVAVDDSAVNRRFLRATLQHWNAVVRTVSKGAEAIVALQEFSQSGEASPILISDTEMPGMNGFELVDQVRSNQSLSEIGIILMTSGPSDVTKCDERDIRNHLMKPLKLAELRSAIIRLAGMDDGEPKNGEGDHFESGKIRPLKVLLVEDGMTNQILAQALLKGWGHSTEVAENGQEAIDLWANGTFDLILMDVQMPVMDGLTATRLIRQRELNAGRKEHIPIVAMTARAIKGDREKCIAAGMDAYVSKPVRRQELYEAIRSLV